MLTRRLLAAALLLISATGVASAEPRERHRKNAARQQAEAGNFDYYLLAMSWAPDFCAFAPGRKDPGECGPGKKLGFIVHGLWPQMENARGPERCGAGRPVSQAVVSATLPYIPVDSLIQHEWTNHGTCSGMSAGDYFATLRKARDTIKVPAKLTSPSQEQHLSPADIEGAFASANPSFPKGAFRATCQNSALQEVRVCFTKDLKPRACGDSVGHCSMGSMTVLPVQ